MTDGSSVTMPRGYRADLSVDRSDCQKGGGNRRTTGANAQLSSHSLKTESGTSEIRAVKRLRKGHSFIAP